MNVERFRIGISGHMDLNTMRIFLNLVTMNMCAKSIICLVRQAKRPCFTPVPILQQLSPGSEPLSFVSWMAGHHCSAELELIGTVSTVEEAKLGWTGAQIDQQSWTFVEIGWFMAYPDESNVEYSLRRNLE